MSKITLQSVATLQNSSIVSAINANNILLEEAIDNTLSRDGTSPNTMSANLDMNNFQIINLPAPATINSPVRVVDINSTGGSGGGVFFPGIANTWLFTQTFTPSIVEPAIIINGPDNLNTPFVSSALMTINKGLNGASALDIKDVVDNSGTLLRLWGPNDVAVGGPAQYFTTGGFLTKLFICISGVSSGSGAAYSITLPTNDASMLAIYADTPLGAQIRSGSTTFEGGITTASGALSILNSVKAYTHSILWDGTLCWGSASNLTYSGQDAFFGRGAAATLQVGGADTGSPVTQNLTSHNVAAPISANGQYAYSKTFHFADVAGINVNDIVTDVTNPAFVAITKVVSIDGAAHTITTDVYGNPYQGDVFHFNGGNAKTLINQVGNVIGYAAVPNGVVVGQTVTDVSVPTAIPGGTTITSIDTSTPPGSGGSILINLSANLDGTLFNTGPGAHDVLHFNTPNTAAANFNIAAGKGTGTGTGGSLAFQVAPAGSSGFNQNSLVSALTIDSNKNIVPNTGAIATNSTNGFTYLATCAGTPNGTPTTFTGRVPMIFDTSGVKFWIYTGGAWKGVVVA